MNSTTVSQFRGLFPATATPSKLLSGRVPVILKLENEWDEYTIAELKTLTIGFSDQNNFLHLTKIEHGCIAVTWLSSTADVKQLKSAVIEAADSLKTMKVLQVFVGEELMLDHSDLYVMHVSPNTVLGRHGSVSLCRVERENKMAATYNVLAFKRRYFAW